MSDPLKKTSKFLSLVLRHNPALVGIALDSAGWVAVEDLLEGCRRNGQPITLEELREVVRSSDKQRFTFSDDGQRIRANQGHSVQVDLGYEPAVPPEVLFHGTTKKYLESIRKNGLEKGKRHHVHLSEKRETAAAGSRHGKLVILEIASGPIHRAGIPFYRTPNGVWLADQVPVEYLKFPG